MTAVLTTIANGVATLTLNRPEQGNTTDMKRIDGEWKIVRHELERRGVRIQEDAAAVAV